MYESLMNISGKLYPPRKKIEVIQEKSTIELYSLKKNNTKIIELCSVKKPATNSDSKCNLLISYIICFII